MSRFWATAQRAGRLLRPDRSPLRRRTDRVEALIILVMLAVMLVGSPVGALTVSRAVLDTGQQAGRAQPASAVSVRPGMSASAVTRLWAVRNGHPVAAPPRGPRGVMPLAIALGVLTPVLLGLILAIAYWAACWLLDQRRLAGWERAWSLVGPEWTKQD